MEVNRTVNVNAAAGEVWRILGTEFSEVDVWAARMLASKGDETLGDLGGRLVETVEYGPTTETLYRYDDQARELAYTVSSDGMPPIISDVTTQWQVEPLADGQSVVTLTFAGQLADESMLDMLVQTWHKGAEPLLDELRHYAETGQPHPRTTETRP